MPEFSSPHLEEFYNHVHDGATGRFSGRAASGREGFREGSPSRKGNAQTHLSPESQKHSPYNLNFTKRAGQPSRHGHGGPANRVDPLNRLQTQKGGASVARATLPKSLGFRHAAKNSSGTIPKQGAALMKKQAAHRAEAARQIDLRNERIQGRLKPAYRAAPKSGTVKQGIRTTRGLRPGEPRDFHKSARERVVAQSGGRTADKIGRPVTGAKLPLRNATTGRINPSPARAAFKQGTSEIIGKKQDSKRTTLTGPKVVPNGYGGGGSHKVSQTVKTVKTYKGRVISHVSSKGGADRAGFREGG